MMATSTGSRFDLGTFETKTVVVSGGLDGIGAACVARFLDLGANVAISHLPTDTDRARAEAFCAASDRRSAHPLDLRDPAIIAQFWQDVTARWGMPDILVNNAAVGSATVAAFSDQPEGRDSAMLAINADGTLKMCQRFLTLVPDARETPQKLINISSVGGGMAVFPSMSLSDGMSKAAVAFLTRQLAAETTHRPVDVFAICPGATNTKMFQASTLNRMEPEPREKFVAGLPKGRLIDPEEIATLVCFLASAHSTVLHGAVIDASMGLAVHPGLMTGH